MALTSADQRLARWSLVAVWVWSSVASLVQADGLSRELLRANAHIPAGLYGWLIWGGALADLILGGLMAWRPAPRVYLGAWAMTLAMTLVATWVDPVLWLHPLGPLLKNLPILALLWLLAKTPS